jgi:CheY-like chemotaxis protein
MNTAKKIMIADDDPAILDSVGLLLEFEGYQVQAIPDATTLLTMETGFPDLLLLDIWMSGTDGRDICKYLKRQKRTSNLPIVLISASREIEQSALEAGANDFLAKPFELNDLIKKIEQHLAV